MERENIRNTYVVIRGVSYSVRSLVQRIFIFNLRDRTGGPNKNDGTVVPLSTGCPCPKKEGGPNKMNGTVVPLSTVRPCPTKNRCGSVPVPLLCPGSIQDWAGLGFAQSGPVLDRSGHWSVPLPLLGLRSTPVRSWTELHP